MSPILTVALVILSPFAMSAPIVYWNWQCPAHRVGPHPCKDADDNALAILYALGLLALALLLVICGFGYLPAFALALVPALWGGWLLRRQWRERRVAAPATLVASEWPLVPGRTVELAFERAIKGGTQPDNLKASLSLEENVSRRGFSVWEQKMSTSLSYRKPTVVDGAVRATWEIVAPDADVPRRWTWGLPTPQARFRWVVKISLHTAEVPELDSKFYLRFRLPPEARSSP